MSSLARMPLVIDSWLSETSAPRRSGGATSPMYIGTTNEAEPTPTPMTKRLTQNSHSTGVSDEASRPTTNTMLVMKMARRRPSWSATRPAARAPMAAPASSMATTRPLVNGVCSPKSSAMLGSTPPTTPVS